MRFISLLICAVAIGLVACATQPNTDSPNGVDLSLTRVSPEKHFVVTLMPPDPVPIQQIHSWRVRVATPEGQPVTGALVYLNGGMPEHGHGLPTRPKVTAELEPGLYLVEGVKFNMHGWWEILIAIQRGPASDITSFNQYFALPPARSN